MDINKASYSGYSERGGASLAGQVDPVAAAPGGGGGRWVSLAGGEAFFYPNPRRGGSHGGALGVSSPPSLGRGRGVEGGRVLDQVLGELVGCQTTMPR